MVYRVACGEKERMSEPELHYSPVLTIHHVAGRTGTKQPYDNLLDVQNWFPIFSQNVETNFSLQVDIRMVNLGLALHFGGRMGVVRGNGKGEMIGRRLPVAGIGTHGHVKRSQVVGIRKGNRRHLAAIQFRNI
jgi:hypothetical protein